MSEAPPAGRGRGVRWLLLAARWAAVAMVLVMVGRHIYALLGDLSAQPMALDGTWLAVAGALYAGGMSCFGLFWRACLRDMSDVDVSISRALAAYWPSQLGKYIPGKAWVVVMRCWALGDQVGAFPTAAASAYETLFMMAVGSGIALAALTAARSETDVRLLVLAGGLMLCLAVVSVPRVFRRLTRLVAAPFRQGAPGELPVCARATLMRGVCILVAGWLMLGASLWAVVRATTAVPAPWTIVPTMAGATALSVVAGFVAFLAPGGIGVREYVLIQTVGPLIGGPQAALVAVAGRLVWVLTEVVGALGSLLWVKSRK